MGRKLHVLLIIIFSLPLIVILQSGFIFVLFGMLPSMFAYFADTGKAKSVYKCVLACNFSGMLPTFGEVMHADSVPAAMQVMMGDILIWMIVYGSAAGGVILLFTCRSITLTSLTISQQTKAELLTKQQEELVEEWGKGVTNQPA